MQAHKCKQIASAAIKMALSESREDEKLLKMQLAEKDIRTAAVDFGGEAISVIPKILERSVVAAKKEGVIADVYSEEGAVAGAAHEALEQVISRAIGLNIGGKIGIARSGSHVAVAVFFEIGMLHLDDIAIGLAHRAVSDTIIKYID